jgi:enoyl-CoA hydratase
MEKSAKPGVHTEIDHRGELGRVATITIDHQAKLNCVNSELIAQLTEAAEKLAEDEELRAVILRGAGERAFIGGADIREMVEISSPDRAMAFISRLHGACDAFRRLPVPVIARIQGYCLGAGLEIAASCDIRIAAEGSQFGMPEVKVGIPSVIEAALLPRLMGWGKAREMIFTGESISARDALESGLVERVVPASELSPAVESVVQAILNCGPRAIRLQKALLSRWEELPIPKAIEEGIKFFGEAYKTDEPREMMRRFLDRKR